MAYLSKEQYEYRRESAAIRNARNERIAIENGMSEQQASLITELCSLRHELHCNIDTCADSSENGILAKIDKLNERIRESGLEGVSFSADFGEVAMIDDIDGLVDYADDIPEDHDGEEYLAWYYENKSRIVSELLQANNEIELYLADIDKKYGTSFCPTGALRINKSPDRSQGTASL